MSETNEQRPSRISIRNTHFSYYNENQAAEYSRLETHIVRYLSDAGLVEGVEVVGEERHYSEADIALLRRVRRLHHDLDINLAGVEVILRLSKRLEALQREVEHYKHQLGERAQDRPEELG